MTETLNKNFIPFCNYLGLGNVKSKLWFVQVDDGREAIDEISLPGLMKDKIDQKRYMEDASNKTEVWKMISDVLYPKHSKSNKPAMADFRKKLFLDEENSHCFLTDLFPLSKSTLTEFPLQYKELFGYTKEGYSKYLSDVRSNRYPIIYNKWKEVQPLLTVCLGHTHFEEYERLFQLGHSSIEVYYEYHKHFTKEKILFLRFHDNKLQNGEDSVLHHRIP